MESVVPIVLLGPVSVSPSVARVVVVDALRLLLPDRLRLGLLLLQIANRSHLVLAKLGAYSADLWGGKLDRLSIVLDMLY